MIIAPSLLSSNFLRLEDEVRMLNASEAGWLHLDVMDGRFVPNITFGMPVIKAISKVAEKPLDVHLMIVEAEKYVDAFADAGSASISVHIEGAIHLHRTLQTIRARGVKAGIAVNPHTPVSALAEVLDITDFVCLMSVNPGFGGQSFIPRSMDKIRELRQMIDARGLSTLIQVDGGVNADNAVELAATGADVLVAGNAVFSAENPTEMIARLQEAGEQGEKVR